MLRRILQRLTWTFFDNHVLSQARTQYKNIAATLDGTIIVGNEHAYFVRGKVVVATSNPEYMADYIEDDDMVILGDREEAQKQAIESNASCLIIGGGIEVGEDVRTLAENMTASLLRHRLILFLWRVLSIRVCRSNSL